MGETVYKGEVQLVRWAETSSGGASITLWLPDSDSLAGFKRMTERKGRQAGQIMAAMFVTVDDTDDAAPAPTITVAKGEHGAWWRKVVASGWFNAPGCARLFGTDADYQAWVRRQPSCISKDYSEWPNGEGRCEYAHVRTAGAAGTAHKPEYSGVPLTHAEHATQHQKGYSAVHPGGLEWFERKAAEYRAKWCMERIKEHFEEDSLTRVSPDKFVEAYGIHETQFYMSLPEYS